MTTGADIIEFARSKIGQYYYTNDLDLRANPEVSGGTDCSGFVNYVYRTLTGIDVGSWTGAQSSAGWEIARGEYPYQIPWEQLQPGDLLLMTANHPGNYAFNAYDCHVELYCGGGTMIGHPGGYGPQEKRAQAWMESYGCSTWMVRRVLDKGDIPTHANEGIKPMRFAVYTSGWLPDGQEGDGSPIRYIAMDFPGWYQVCTADNGWLPVVYRFDQTDFISGCAGDGSPITAVRAYMETPNPTVNGWHAVKYAVGVAGGGYMPYMIDLHDTSGSGDDFAGNFTPITEFKSEIVRV